MSGNGNEHSSSGHVTPIWILVAVAAALFALTYLTVSVTEYDFGPTTNLWIAMIIATVKASMVAIYFMHLRWEKPMLRIVFIGSLLFVLLFVGFVMTDSASYGPDLIDGYAPQIEALQ